MGMKREWRAEQNESGGEGGGGGLPPHPQFPKQSSASVEMELKLEPDNATQHRC